MEKKVRLKNEVIADADFFASWKNYVWKLAWDFNRSRFPGYDLEDFVSIGMFALTLVPSANRWSTNYVKTIVRNEMLNVPQKFTRWKRKGHQYTESLDAPVREDVLEGHTPISVQDPNGVKGIHEFESRMMLEPLMKRLNDREFQIISFLLGGWTTREISEQTGMSRALVSLVYQKALRRMQKRSLPKSAHARSCS
jgi:RNA polymerase sigma factor (sigma-70 family)